VIIAEQIGIFWRSSTRQHQMLQPFFQNLKTPKEARIKMELELSSIAAGFG
jgi:hypothetical protein